MVNVEKTGRTSLASVPEALEGQCVRKSVSGLFLFDPNICLADPSLAIKVESKC